MMYYPWPVVTLILLLALATFSGVGFVAIWAGLGRGHWFVGTAVAVGVSALPLLIAAYELILLLLLQSLSTIFLLRMFRRRQRRAQFDSEQASEEPRVAGNQILLRDLLLLMVIAALISTTVAPIPREVWAETPYLVAAGGCLALGTLVAAWIGRGRSRWWWRLLAACVLFPTALVALFLSLVRPSNLPMPRRKKATVAILASLIFVPPVVALCVLRMPTAIPEAPPLGPNVYTDWVQAAKLLPLANTPRAYESSPEVLKAFVVQYRSALDQAHAAVQRSGHVPLQYDMNDMSRITPYHSQARNLAWAFDSEAVAAHQEGRDDDALRCCLDVFRLGDAMSRGGLLVEWLTKVAIEGIGACRLAGLRHEFSASQCRQAIDTIRKLEAQSEPFDVVAARDRVWESRSYPRYIYLAEQISRLIDLSRQPDFTLTVKLTQARKRLLLTELALCAYRQEHGGLPESLAELVPDYLPTVLEDPFSGKALIYWRTATGHQLYSVGADGKDDGGQPPTSGGLLGPGDFLLEEPAPTERGTTK